MSHRWNLFLAEAKRIYNIIFETRPIEIIQKDFYEHKWISKLELQALFEWEKIQLLELCQKKDKEIQNKEEEYNLLLGNYNTTALHSYALMERKFQGKLKI